MSISVVINTLNEEKNIERAIDSVKKFADEVIVVDMESSDATVKVAKKLGAKVFSHKPMHYVEPARNFAISKAKNDWIFILDADEEATSALVSELKKVAAEGRYNFVRVPRKNIIFGEWMKHSRWWPDYNIRFFKKGAVVWEDEIHSIPVTTGDGLNLQAEEHIAIVHHNYDNVEQFIDRLNRYTTIQAQELHKRGKTTSYVELIHKPIAEFLSRYFAGEGYKDGLHGLSVALLQGFSELIVYVKVWQLSGFEKEKPPLKAVISAITASQKETNYWKAHSLLQEGGGVAQKVKRKFKLQ